MCDATRRYVADDCKADDPLLFFFIFDLLNYHHDREIETDRQGSAFDRDNWLGFSLSLLFPLFLSLSPSLSGFFFSLSITLFPTLPLLVIMTEALGVHAWKTTPTGV